MTRSMVRSPVGAGDDMCCNARTVISVMPELIGHLNLKLVLHIADDLTVEEVHYALSTGCVLL